MKPGVDPGLRTMRHDGRSERQYFRFLRELHIADIGPQPPADAELDRNDDDIVALQIIGSEAADEIEFALDLRNALEQTLGVIKVIDESERLRRIRAEIGRASCRERVCQNV